MAGRKAVAGRGKGELRRVEYSGINEPGVYLFEREGMLMRIPEDGLTDASTPLVPLYSNSPVWMWRLSTDPWLPMNKARNIAANNDLAVEF